MLPILEDLLSICLTDGWSARDRDGLLICVKAEALAPLAEEASDDDGYPAYLASQAHKRRLIRIDPNDPSLPEAARWAAGYFTYGQHYRSRQLLPWEDLGFLGQRTRELFAEWFGPRPSVRRARRVLDDLVRACASRPDEHFFAAYRCLETQWNIIECLGHLEALIGLSGIELRRVSFYQPAVPCIVCTHWNAREGLIRHDHPLLREPALDARDDMLREQI